MKIFRTVLVALALCAPFAASAQMADAGQVPAPVGNVITGKTTPGGIVEFWVDGVKIASERADKDGNFSFNVPSDIAAANKNVQVRYYGVYGGAPTGSFSGGAVGCSSVPESFGASWVVAAGAALAAFALRRRDTRA